MNHDDLPNLNPIDDLTATTHAEIAAALQDGVDQAIAAGDYSAASELREVAESEAWLAGDSSMLHGSDAIDLSSAADSQVDATYYEELQAEAAREGDYEAARDAAWEAADATQSADFNAGGDDHAGQPLAEKYEMELAMEDKSLADWHVEQADAWAADGAFDTAESHLELAAENYEAADAHGAFGEHGAPGAIHDPTSETTEVDTWQIAESSFDVAADATTFDAGIVDTTSYDTTSYDTSSSYDTTSSYDSTGLDTV